jgi:hypothetical protein
MAEYYLFLGTILLGMLGFLGGMLIYDRFFRR